jgi:hypothetical protein
MVASMASTKAALTAALMIVLWAPLKEKLTAARTVEHLVKSWAEK